MFVFYFNNKDYSSVKEWVREEKRRKRVVECQTERWMHYLQDVFHVNTWVLTCGVKFMRGGDWCIVALRLFVRGMVLTENTSCPVHTHKWKTVTISGTSCYSYPNAHKNKTGNVDPLSKGHTQTPCPKTGPERVDKTFQTNTMQTTVLREINVLI